ncbi:MAG TPA: TetR/AcrR family transcriptional regulator [Candidatus Stackebrandtia excrementipullorum]|nr:TetR/AcrR family transcriptional regulator [Candidatus Stackebrandtia excrementipullorum]
MKRWNRTHEALRQAAVKLFTERGYDATTTTEIAAHAGVSEMTLFRHFRTKESLLSADPFDPLMAEAVRGRPPGEPPMQALTEGIRRALAQLHEEDVEDLRMLLRIIASTPSLRGAIERGSEETATALVAALRDRGVAEAKARVAATALITGLGTALLDWARSETTTVNAALGDALDVLGGN